MDGYGLADAQARVISSDDALDASNARHAAPAARALRVAAGGVARARATTGARRALHGLCGRCRLSSDERRDGARVASERLRGVDSALSGLLRRFAFSRCVRGASESVCAAEL